MEATTSDRQPRSDFSPHTLSQSKTEARRKEKIFKNGRKLIRYRTYMEPDNLATLEVYGNGSASTGLATVMQILSSDRQLRRTVEDRVAATRRLILKHRGV